MLLIGSSFIFSSNGVTRWKIMSRLLAMNYSSSRSSRKLWLKDFFVFFQIQLLILFVRIYSLDKESPGRLLRAERGLKSLNERIRVDSTMHAMNSRTNWPKRKLTEITGWENVRGWKCDKLNCSSGVWCSGRNAMRILRLVFLDLASYGEIIRDNCVGIWVGVYR